MWIGLNWIWIVLNWVKLTRIDPKRQNTELDQGKKSVGLVDNKSTNTCQGKFV